MSVRARGRLMLGFALTLGCGSGNPPAAGEPEPVPPNSADAGTCGADVLYVSANGDDANTGCDSAKPKKTIENAIGFSRSKNVPHVEVRTCAETIREHVIVGSSVSIVGGFDCTTWKPGAGRTTIEVATDEVETFIAFGAAVDASSRFEHLKIVGPKRATGPVVAMRFKNGCAPYLRDVEVHGGSTDEGFSQSVSVELASPTIEDSTIIGGRAHCVTSCVPTLSTGVALVSGTPVLRRLRIDGGVGEGPSDQSYVGAAALDAYGYLTVPAELSFEDLELTAGVGRITKGIASATVRAVDGAHVELVDSKLLPSSTPSTCEHAPCVAYGLVAQGHVRLQRTRVTPTTVVAAPGASGFTPSAHGVSLSNGDVTLWSSSVFAPDRALDVLGSSSRLVVRASTIVGGEILSSTSDVSIGGSVLGSMKKDVPAFELADCGGVSRTSIDSSVVIGAPQTFAKFFAQPSPNVCDPTGSTTTLAGMTASKGFTASNVLRITTACDGEAGGTCLARAECAGDPSSCLATVLAPNASFLDPRLKDGVPCAIANGGVRFAEISTDVFAATRTDPVAMGAHEYDGTCSP